MINIPLPEWSEALFNKENRYVAVYGGRGGGKSRAISAALVIRAAQEPLRILCAREIQKSIRDSVKRLLDDDILRLGLEDKYQSTDTEIRGKNGSLFIFAGLRTNIESIKSMEGIDICWVEEAQTVSQQSLNILVPTIRKRDSQIFFSWNPYNETDPIDVMFRGNLPPPRSKVLSVNYINNPWFPEVLREEMEHDKERDLDKYKHIWLGSYVSNSDARVFNNWVTEDFQTPDDAVFRFGADWGFAKDPTTLVRCYMVGRKLYIDHEAYLVGCEILDTPDLFLTVPESENWPIVADSARPETISHMTGAGFKIMPAVKGQNSVREGIEWLKTYDIVVHPRCRRMAYELTHYRYKTDPLTGKVLPILEDKHNHLIDALRYACEAYRRVKEKKVPEVKVLPTANRW